MIGSVIIPLTASTNAYRHAGSLPIEFLWAFLAFVVLVGVGMYLMIASSDASNKGNKECS